MVFFVSSGVFFFPMLPDALLQEFRVFNFMESTNHEIRVRQNIVEHFQVSGLQERQVEFYVRLNFMPVSMALLAQTVKIGVIVIPRVSPFSVVPVVDVKRLFMGATVFTDKVRLSQNFKSAPLPSWVLKLFPVNHCGYYYYESCNVSMLL